MKRQFPFLKPDSLDADEVTLDSFSSIRQKTWEAIYQSETRSDVARHRDKSPKGSVDAPIRHVVDLINSHPMFTTLSSCSGRIALYDPSMKANHSQDSTTKQSGGWLLVEHEPIAPSSLSSILFSNCNTSTVSFRMEPLLLHVAAANIERGKQLLRVVLSAGFRESGMTITNQRVTVAIRSHGLALCIPWARTGPLKPSEAYVMACADEANRKLRSNKINIGKLFRALAVELFRSAKGDIQVEEVQILPGLNLFNHSTAVVTVGAEDKLLAFGGSGPGPSSMDCDANRFSAHRQTRSNKIYCLSRSSIHNTWDDTWSEVSQCVGHHAEVTLFGVRCSASKLAAHEGCATCILPGTNLVLLFGGRRSPTSPVSDMLIYDHANYPGTVWAPDVWGTFPTRRWGHSLVTVQASPLSNRWETPLAVLYGGRSESQSMNSVHLLFVHERDNRCQFVWEELHCEGVPGRFNHAAFCVDEKLIVYGGVEDPLDVTESALRSSGFCVDICTSRVQTFDEAFCSNESRLLSMSHFDDLVGIYLYFREHSLGLPNMEWLGPFVQKAICRTSAHDIFVCVGEGVVGFGFGDLAAKLICARYAWLADASLRGDVPPSPTRPWESLLRSQSSEPPAGETAYVVYVRKQHAKTVKTLLEKSQQIHPRCRMMAVDRDFVVLPLISNSVELESSIERFVDRRGKVMLPLRTAMFAGKHRKTGKI